MTIAANDAETQWSPHREAPTTWHVLAAQAECDPPTPGKSPSLATLRSWSTDRLQAHYHDRIAGLAYFRPVETAQLASTVDAITSLARRNHGARPPQSGLVVTSEQGGTGKSTAVQEAALRIHRELRERKLDIVAPTHEHIPVAYVTVEASATAKELSQQLLDFYGVPYAQRDPLPQLSRSLRANIERAGTRVIILDEIHNLEGNRAGRKSNDYIKALQNTARATIILCGLSVWSTEALSGARSDQTAERFGTIEIQPYSIATKQDAVDFQRLILGIERQLPLAAHTPGDLATKHAEYIHQVTGGHAASLAEWLRAAADIAMKPNDGKPGPEKITLDTLKNTQLVQAAALRRERL